ncbi:acetamidase/formamidase family protein [Fibrivirga algicola]|uniref:Acetamidase n=1 Tax=Fibrivirga algicola TaxID=2950420 RepID=A0ABX0QPE9_9BACT|nr:acetamidase/formamidase family protein [Fibrivirga algicola]NID12752.1 acetamidase [Fibrivirga algicola]
MSTSRRRFFRQSAQRGAAALTLPTILQAFSTETAQAATTIDLAEPARLKPTSVVRSLPENMVWGYFGADVPPVSRIKDGDIVEIQTVNPSGVSRTDPEAFYKTNNLTIDDHAKEVIAIMKQVKPEPSGIRGHMLTGPIYIENAQPGDHIEIRILDLTLPADFGVNSVWPGGGGIPDLVKQRETFVYRYDAKRRTGTFIDGVEIPLKPFMGVMALSPPPETGRVSSIPPAFFGGNLDIKHLTKHSTLHLPVSVPGGLFTTGDGHAAQGNGEVSGVAIETAVNLTAQFIVHKNSGLKMPRAETPTHFIAVGLDKDLDKAMKQALAEAVQFIQTELGFTFNQALSIASTGVDLEISQVVDQVLGVHAMIPKAIFPKKKFGYW